MKVKDFKLTVEIERSVLPLMVLQEQITARMILLRKKDDDIKATQEAIDEARELLDSWNVESGEIKAVDELAAKIAEKDSELTYMLLADREINELDAKVKELMLDEKFYIPLIRHCYEYTDEEFEKIKDDAVEIEKHVAFFLTDLRPKKRNSLNTSREQS